MKKLLPVTFIFSFILFLFSGSGQAISLTRTRHKDGTFCSDSHSENSMLTTPGQQGAGFLNIRHRSALENETVIMPVYARLIIFREKSTDTHSGFYSKWKGYFSSLPQILSPQVSILAATGLRAPPLFA